MRDLELLQRILRGLPEGEQVEVWNTYNDRIAGGDDEGKIFPMAYFDTLCAGMTPLQIADILYDQNFDPEERWFYQSPYGGILSTNDLSVALQDFPDIADYIVDYSDALGNDTIKKYLEIYG